MTIAGFYDDVTPLTPTEQAALAEAPNVEAALKKEFGVVKPERAEERLERKLNTPTLSILAMESGGGLQRAGPIGDPGVGGGAPRDSPRQRARSRRSRTSCVVAHMRKQGYFVVVDRDPTDEERRRSRCSRASICAGGSPASRVSMDVADGAGGGRRR